MEYFYYLRDADRRPVVTICLMTDNGDWSRGMAICSPRDNPCKKRGRAIAYCRAKEGFRHRSFRDPIVRDEAILIIETTMPYEITRFDYKSDFRPTPTYYELHLIRGTPMPIASHPEAMAMQTR